MMKEALRSSDTSFITRATRRSIPETPFFIVTALKTSDLVEFRYFGLRLSLSPSSLSLFLSFKKTLPSAAVETVYDE
jgi:hypothetical protein